MSHNHEEHNRPEHDERVVVIEEIIIVEEIIDIEEYAKKKKKPPHAKGYRIRIDKEYKEVHVPEMTGRQILALVGKTPETYLLSQKIHGGQVIPIGADQKVDFRHPGIERFQTLALDPTEGGGNAS
ncbi:MAG: multiubiquitin domain-containing protein [Planctomycetota bacterium]|jgi:hypothetical protein|nr:multiubiquitin domain-containing protein [Planctomycetota bacterium]